MYMLTRTFDMCDGARMCMCVCASALCCVLCSEEARSYVKVDLSNTIQTRYKCWHKRAHNVRDYKGYYRARSALETQWQNTSAQPAPTTLCFSSCLRMSEHFVMDLLSRSCIANSRVHCRYTSLKLNYKRFRLLNDWPSDDKEQSVTSMASRGQHKTPGEDSTTKLRTL